MKHIILSIAILGIFFSFTQAQVGINTTLPNATLEVASNPANSNSIDGFIAPKLKGSELKAKDALYTTSLSGTIVYVTEPLASNERTPKTINITHSGYYYFDGNVWNGWTNTKNSTIFKAKVNSSQNILDLKLLSSYQNLNFSKGSDLIFNGLNNPIDTNGIITIQETGIYAVGFYFRYGTGVNLSLLDLTTGGFSGIRIIKNIADNVIDSKSFSGTNLSLNLAVVSIGVLNLVISNSEINSIYKFEKGDQLTLQTRLGGLISLSLLSGSEGSFYMYKISD